MKNLLNIILSFLAVIIIVSPLQANSQARLEHANLDFNSKIAPALLLNTDLGEGLTFTKFSSFIGSKIGAKELTSFGKVSDEKLLQTIKRVIREFGEHERVRSIRVAAYLGGDLPGAAFVDVEGTAYLVIAPTAVAKMRSVARGSEDILIAFLAHELTHIFNQDWGQNGSGQKDPKSLSADAIARLKSNLIAEKRLTEKNADIFSGQVAQRLGVSREDAVKAVEIFAAEEGNSTYASKGQRKQYVNTGWLRGCYNNPDNCDEAGFESEELRKSAANNVVVGVLNIPSEASEEFRDRFGSIFYRIVSAAAQSHFKKRNSQIDGIDLKQLAFVPAKLPDEVNAALAAQAYSFGNSFELLGIINSDVDWDEGNRSLDVDSQFFVVGQKIENQTYFEESSRIEDTYSSPRRYTKKGQFTTRWGNLAALAKAIELIEQLENEQDEIRQMQIEKNVEQLISLSVLDLRCPMSGGNDEIVHWIRNNKMTSKYLKIDLQELCVF